MKKLFIIPFVAMLCVFTANAQEKKNISLEDIFITGAFRSNGFAGFNVMKDGENYTEVMEYGEQWVLVKRSLITGDSTGFVVKSSMLGGKVEPLDYEFSGDESHLLFKSAEEAIYRHSSRSYVDIVNINSGRVNRLSPDKVMYASISPNNKNVAYVKDNNLYIFNLASGLSAAITTDGKAGQIINGAVDWVYEEEFSMSRGFEWNSAGTAIAYYRFDESHVKEFSMDMYDGLYPYQEKWKYPKAGEANSVVDVYIYSVTDKTNLKINTGSENDQYLPRIKWTNAPQFLSIQRLNRLQNKWELLLTSGKGDVVTVLTENSETYVDISDNLYFLNDQVLYTSEKNGYNHIYCYDLIKEKGKQLTSGNWDVISVYGVDEEKELVYFSSSEISPTEDHLFSIKLNGKDKKSLTPEPGNHTISWAAGNKYFVDIHSNISTPARYTLRGAQGTWSRELVNNDALTEKFTKYNIGKTEFGQLPGADGTMLNYYMIKPHDFVAGNKYPVLMYVYGGPGINTVRNSFSARNYTWYQMLAQKGYIVLSVDNRGTGNRGAGFKKSTYANLGKLEHLDQEAAAKWLGAQEYIDKSRIGIWGWSFGGYMTSLCMTKSPDIFKVGVAVAPVTNWRFYDNIYTERFLKLPKDNAAGYDENSPINFVKNIKGKYLIIHGTGDDNVHFQNTVEMVHAMIRVGAQFDSEFYPNRNHGIGDRPAQYHLFRRITNYITDNL